MLAKEVVTTDSEERKVPRAPQPALQPAPQLAALLAAPKPEEAGAQLKASRLEI